MELPQLEGQLEETWCLCPVINQQDITAVPFETPQHKGALKEKLARTHYPQHNRFFSQHCFGVSCNLDKNNVEDVFIACRGVTKGRP